MRGSEDGRGSRGLLGAAKRLEGETFVVVRARGRASRVTVRKAYPLFFLAEVTASRRTSYFECFLYVDFLTGDLKCDKVVRLFAFGEAVSVF